MPRGLKPFHQTRQLDPSATLGISAAGSDARWTPRLSVVTDVGRNFWTPESCSIFEAALERVRQQHELCVYGYVVMPEHVHLLVSEPERGTLAQAM